MPEDFKKHCEEHGVYTYPVEVPRPDKLHESLERVAALLRWQAGDCDCYEDEGTKTTHKCFACTLRERAQEVEACLEVEHVSIHPDRQGSPAERIYAEMWQKQQERSPGLNDGFGLLELILSPLRQDNHSGFLGHRPYRMVPPVSQRDAQVAATVIQWLGTSCGGSFIRQAERAIEQARQRQTEFRHHVQQMFVNKTSPPIPQEIELAEAVAANHFQAGTKQYEKLKQDVAAALRSVKASGDQDES